MSEAMTAEVREKIKDKVWAKAQELGWEKIPQAERSKWYENWSKDKDIGGVLSRYMDTRKIRVYIKDTLLKPYLRSCLEKSWDQVRLVISADAKGRKVIRRLEKPHGHILDGGLVVCWGNSRDWKAVVISAYERAYALDQGSAHSVVLLEAEKKTDCETKKMISDVAIRLGVSSVHWVD